MTNHHSSLVKNIFFSIFVFTIFGFTFAADRLDGLARKPQRSLGHVCLLCFMCRVSQNGFWSDYAGLNFDDRGSTNIVIRSMWHQHREIQYHDRMIQSYTLTPTSRDTVVTHGIRIILSVATEAGGFSKRSVHAIRQVSSTREHFHLEVYASDQ